MRKLIDKVKSFFKKEDKISEDIFCIKYKDIPFWIPGRGMGNTTRLVDSYVQDFFIKGTCEVKDHYDKRVSHKRVFRLVLSRLKHEHKINEKNLELNNSRLTITNPNFK